MLCIDLQVQQGDLSLQVKTRIPNTATALSGPSGCGKTTLLRAIAGLMPSRGTLIFNEETWQNDSVNVPSHRRRIGFVFQDDRLFPHLNVEENLRYGLERAQANGNEIKLNLADVAKHFDLHNLLRRRTNTLSGGESRRVNIARAVLGQPQLLLLDEPLTGLDNKRKADVLPYLAKITRELQIPTLYVSHINDEIAQFCDHMIVMQHGHLVDQGATAQVLPRLWREPLGTGQSLSEAGSLLNATVINFDPGYSMIHLLVANQPLQVVGPTLPETSAVRLFLAAKDVAIALQPPTDLSIRDTLAATIGSITPMQDEATGFVAVELTIEHPTEPQTLSAHITAAACDALSLEVGAQVFALIKSARISTPSIFES